MGRAAKHNWRNLFLEYNQGRYKNVAEFAKKKGLNYDQVRKAFKKFEKETDGSKPGKTGQKNRLNPGNKNERSSEPDKKHTPWEKIKTPFLDWPEEKLQVYVIQIEERLAELNSVDYDELTPEEKKELGQLRRDRRAILSDPDPDKICKAVRKGKKCNNPVERGKEVCWNHGGAPGSGCPPGRKNALKTGEYETIWLDALDEDESYLVHQIVTDPIKQADEAIRLLTIRERRMMKRIQRLMAGLTEKQRRVLQERKTVKEPITVYDEKSGETKVVVRSKEELVVTEIEETEYRAIEDILRIEEALTRVQDKKLKAIEVKYKLETNTEPGQGNSWADLVAKVEGEE